MQGTAPHAFSIDAFNRATRDQATAMMDRIVERSAWLARRAALARPFGTTEDLAAWIDREVRSLTRDEALQLLCAHPELAPPDPAGMTVASQSEQSRLDILNLDRETSEELAELNRRYTRRHGYPFIVALHEHDDFEGVLDQFESRVSADPDEELGRSLGQVISVMKARLARLSGVDRRSADMSAAKVAAESNMGGSGS